MSWVEFEFRPDPKNEYVVIVGRVRLDEENKLDYDCIRFHVYIEGIVHTFRPPTNWERFYKDSIDDYVIARHLEDLRHARLDDRLDYEEEGA